MTIGACERECLFTTNRGDCAKAAAGPGGPAPPAEHHCAAHSPEKQSAHMVAVSNPAAGQKTLWFNPAGNKEDTDFERVSLCKQRGALATNVHIHMVAQNHGHVRMPWSNSTARSSGVPRPHHDQRRRSTPEARRRATGGVIFNHVCSQAQTHFDNDRS